MALKKCDCALCDHARIRKDICGIYCVGGFWKKADGTCDHYVDYMAKRRTSRPKSAQELAALGRGTEGDCL